MEKSKYDKLEGILKYYGTRVTLPYEVKVSWKGNTSEADSKALFSINKMKIDGRLILGFDSLDNKEFEGLVERVMALEKIHEYEIHEDYSIKFKLHLTGRNRKRSKNWQKNKVRLVGMGLISAFRLKKIIVLGNNKSTNRFINFLF